jgi:hypothetical protein
MFYVVNELEGVMAGKNLRLGNAKNRFGAYTGQWFVYAS